MIGYSKEKNNMSKKCNQVEIIFLYQNSQNREINFSDIVSGNDLMDLEDYDSETFWRINGGIKIIIDEYITIFHSSDFEYLVKAINFILKSMFWINNISSEWFDNDDDYPNDVVCVINSKLLIIKEFDNKNISISYYPNTKNHTRQRGECFFKDIIIDKKDWLLASNIALKEYYEILLKIIKLNSNSNNNKIMNDYYSLWHDNLKKINLNPDSTDL